ncbi:MAG: cohesin domain-containing protein [bacterium]
MEGRFRKKITKKLATIFGLAVAFFIFIAVGASANAATLYLSPSSGNYNPGDTFSVSVYANSSDQSMNAASSRLSFPSNMLEVTSVSKTGSIITFWAVEPSFDNISGRVNFEGVVLTANGYIGSSGKLITINFKAKEAGTANVSFSSGSILANDGLGTNILAGMGSFGFVINDGEAPKPKPEPKVEPKPEPVKFIESKLEPEPEPKPEYDEEVILPERIKSEYTGNPVITSPTHPDQNAWYNIDEALFEWDMPYDAIGVSVMMTDEPDSNPGPNSDGLFFAKKYKNIEDGTHYLHLKIKDNDGWSEIDHYRVNIDTVPPKPFKINVAMEESTGHAMVSFHTTDALSGIDRYRIKIDNEYFESTAKEYLMDVALMIGDHTIIVRAIDKAGNETLAAADINIYRPVSTAISIFPDKMRVTDKLFLGGTDQADARFTLFVKNKEIVEPIIKETIVADENGKWSFIYVKDLMAGDYVAWIQREGSEEVEALIEFSVGAPVLWQVGGLNITYFGIIAFLIHLVVLISVLAFYMNRSIFNGKNSCEKMRELIDSTLSNHKRLVDKEINKIGRVKDLKKFNVVCNKSKGVLKDNLDEIEKKLVSSMRKMKK